MEGYYFLYGLAILWLVFAAVQDMRKREVANWLNFSLITFGLAYKLIYSSYFGNWNLFLYGIFGLAVFIGLAYGFYYGRVFGGGDAKLLMALGAVLPFESFWGFLIVGGGFLLLLFSVGAVWTLGYSIFIVMENRRKFVRKFHDKLKGKKLLFGVMVLLALLMGGSVYFYILVLLSLWVLLALYFYVKAVDDCMIKEVSAEELREGDWLEGDVRIGNGVIKKSVHGLSLEEIARIRRAGKRVLIKEGVPFAPTFLIAMLVMVFFWGNISLFLGKLIGLF